DSDAATDLGIVRLRSPRASVPRRAVTRSGGGVTGLRNTEEDVSRSAEVRLTVTLPRGREGARTAPAVRVMRGLNSAGGRCSALLTCHSGRPQEDRCNVLQSCQSDPFQSA